MTIDTTAAPSRLARRARLMKAMNVPMRALLRLPFATPLSGGLMLVSYTGRKTGRSYRQPVSYVGDGGALLTPGGGKWKLNLRDGDPVHLRLRGRDVLARPELVRASDDVEVLLGRMLAANRRLSSFIPFVDPDGSVDRAKLQNALDHGFCVVRWHLGGDER